MVGFSFKNLMLQIIHGSIIIITIAFLILDSGQINISRLTGYESLIILLFLIASFSIGVMVDFMADILESFALKSPIYHLLTKEHWMGITLAHNGYILDQLCKIAAKYDLHDGDAKYYMDHFKNKDKKIINYILQVAKNRAFRKCEDYQKDQIDSFFILYIFSRNLAFSLFISSLLLKDSHIIITVILILLVVFALISSYRYYLYYSRILLGSTFKFKRVK